MTEPHTLHRRDAVETSVEAAYAIDANNMEQVVYHAILSYGPDGCISDDVQDYLAARDLAYSTVTARYAALVSKDLIYRDGEKRRARSGRNMLVMRATRFKPAEDAELSEIEDML